MKIKCIKTGAVSDVGPAHWAEIQRRPGLAKAFKLLEVPIPPEVIALTKRKQKEQEADKTA